MDNLTTGTKQAFFQFLNGELSIIDFEQWIYKSSVLLEQELSPDFHFELISFDYNQKDSHFLLAQKLKVQIDANEYNIWRTKKLLVQILDDKIDLVLASRKLRELYYDTGEKFIPLTLGIGYESVFDHLPIPDEYDFWDRESLKETLKTVTAYKDDFIRDAKLFLEKLEGMSGNSIPD